MTDRISPQNCKIKIERQAHLFPLQSLSGRHSPAKLLQHRRQQPRTNVLQPTRSVGTTTTALHWKPANGFIFLPRAVGYTFVWSRM